MSELRCSRCLNADNSKLLGHELGHIYDGVLFWSCMKCGFAWPRWFEGRRGEASRLYSDMVNTALGSIEVEDDA